MCKRRTRPTATATQPYEGETIRLGGEQALKMEQPRARHHCFPWWTLWLIWPLIGVFKWMLPLLIGAIGGLMQIMIPLLPVLLIVLGLLLLRRR